jgi:hypothetical protein
MIANTVQVAQVIVAPSSKPVINLSSIREFTDKTNSFSYYSATIRRRKKSQKEMIL